MASLDAQLLGGFRFKHAGEDVREVQSERLALLISRLLLEAEQPPTRKQIAYLFWPDTSEEQARTNLRNLFHLLKKAFPETDSFLDLEGQTVRWRDVSALEVDALQFQSAL